MPIEESSAEGAPSPIATGAGAPKHARRVLHFSIVSVAAAVIWFVTWMAIAGTAGLGTWTISMIVPSACVVLFALIVLRQAQQWSMPVRQVTHMVPQIRAGQMPIDALDQIDGGLKELAGQLRGLLREVRQQKSEIAQLEDEMRQRVANRTDALERKIGSLRQQTVRDSLTGLLNRRGLDQYLPEAITKCRQEKSDLSLLMIDVDHFKVLNDTLGHPAGDALLRNIGQIIRSTIREHDAAFRCGGDEFVVVLPTCGPDNADTLAARLDSLVLGLTKTFRISHQPKLSIGLASLSQLREQNAQTLIEAADKRLYEIKSTRAALSRTAPIAKAG